MEAPRPSCSLWPVGAGPPAGGHPAAAREAGAAGGAVSVGPTLRRRAPRGAQPGQWAKWGVAQVAARHTRLALPPGGPRVQAGRAVLRRRGAGLCFQVRT